MGEAATRKAVYTAIDSERDYQIARWGHDHFRTVGEYLVYIQDYVREAMTAASREPDNPQGSGNVSDNTKNIVRKITALGVACMEHNGAPVRPPYVNPQDFRGQGE